MVVSVANKKIKLGRTFSSAVSTNKAGDRKFYRLCVALDWFKIGLNDNIFFAFFLNTLCAVKYFFVIEQLFYACMNNSKKADEIYLY